MWTTTPTTRACRAPFSILRREGSRPRISSSRSRTGVTATATATSTTSRAGTSTATRTIPRPTTASTATPTASRARRSPRPTTGFSRPACAPGAVSSRSRPATRLSTGTPTQAGVAALVIAAGLDAVQAGRLAGPLSADEVKQVVRSTVSPIDDPTLPFPGLPGATFNIQYGYGRPNVYRAVQAIRAGQVPPTADILQPAWYQEVDPTLRSALSVCAAVAARNPGRYSWKVEYGLGPQPLEAELVTIGSGRGTRPATACASLRLASIPSSFWMGDFAITSDRLSIERYDVTVRVRVTDAAGLVGEDRRVFHLRHDVGEMAGFPVYLGSSGESSPTIADLERRRTLDVVVATASGAVHVLRSNGREAPGFPVFTGPAPGMDPSSDVNYLAVPHWAANPADRPRDGIAAPAAVGDVH